MTTTSVRFFRTTTTKKKTENEFGRGEEEKYAHIDFPFSLFSFSVILEIHPFDVLHSFDRRPSGGNGNGSKRRRNYAQLMVPGIDDDDDDREEET